MVGGGSSCNCGQSGSLCRIFLIAGFGFYSLFRFAKWIVVLFDVFSFADLRTDDGLFPFGWFCFDWLDNFVDIMHLLLGSWIEFEFTFDVFDFGFIDTWCLWWNGSWIRRLFSWLVSVRRLFSVSFELHVPSNGSDGYMKTRKCFLPLNPNKLIEHIPLTVRNWWMMLRGRKYTSLSCNLIRA